MRKRLELHIMAKKCVESLKKVQRNLDLTKCHGTCHVGSTSPVGSKIAIRMGAHRACFSGIPLTNTVSKGIFGQ